MGTGIEMCFMGTNEGQLLRTMGPKPQWMEQMKGATIKNTLWSTSAVDPSTDSVVLKHSTLAKSEFLCLFIFLFFNLLSPRIKEDRRSAGSRVLLNFRYMLTCPTLQIDKW